MTAWNPFRPQPLASKAALLYEAIVARARDPLFYNHGGVPDTLDGRFEMVALHCYLVLRRLRAAGPAAEEAGQALVDALFADLDANLRELGAGDLGVGKRVKRMAAGFYGRVAAYDRGQADGTLAEALRRNLFGTVPATSSQTEAMADYVSRAGAVLAAQPLETILAGHPSFGEVEGRSRGSGGRGCTPEATS